MTTDQDRAAARRLIGISVGDALRALIEAHGAWRLVPPDQRGAYRAYTDDDMAAELARLKALEDGGPAMGKPKPKKKGKKNGQQNGQRSANA